MFKDNTATLSLLTPADADTIHQLEEMWKIFKEKTIPVQVGWTDMATVATTAYFYNFLKSHYKGMDYNEDELMGFLESCTVKLPNGAVVKIEGHLPYEDADLNLAKPITDLCDLHTRDMVIYSEDEKEDYLDELRDVLKKQYNGLGGVGYIVADYDGDEFKFCMFSLDDDQNIWCIYN